MGHGPYRTPTPPPTPTWWQRALCWLGSHDVGRWNYMPPHAFWGRCARCGREVWS